MKLFMCYVGGSTQTSNIELHDVRFCVGESVTDCYDDLRRQWWGTPASLHLDCWGEVEQVDGYDVTVLDAAAAGGIEAGPRLFFVNLGGYSATHFGELHENRLVVAEERSLAVRRALAGVGSWTQPHRDNAFEVDSVIDVAGQVQGGGHALALTPAATRREFRFTCDYVPVG